MMQAALAMRNYTSKQIKPLLETQMKYTFLPQTVPAYAATESFNDLRTKYPEYGYKEATLNPTNPRDRTNDWEADIVNQFRNGTDMTEIIGERIPRSAVLSIWRARFKSRTRPAWNAAAP
jgi:protein-histidine pros-kinase